MKYAVIADIHGNYNALSAVLEDAEKEKVDGYIFVGDYYMCFPLHNEVVERIRELKNAIIVMGNEEERLIKLSKQNQDGWVDGQFSGLYWYYKNITDKNRSYLTSFPNRIDIDINGVQIHIAHSSKTFENDAIINEPYASEYTKAYYMNHISMDEFLCPFLNQLGRTEENCSDLRTKDIYIFGHTHIQWHCFNKENLFINPGACGFPSDAKNGSPYVILEITEDNVIIEERRIEYDEELTVEELKNSELYGVARVWNDIIIKEYHYKMDFIGFFLGFAENYAQKIGDYQRPFSKETFSSAYEIWKTKEIPFD